MSLSLDPILGFLSVFLIKIIPYNPYPFENSDRSAENITCCLAGKWH
jgi:hypothetical protein